MSLRKFFVIIKYGFIQWLFPKLQKYLPWLADRWSPWLFFTPPRLPLPNIEKKWLKKANHSVLNYRGGKVNVYSWGKGPPVLMVHGWAGRGTHFCNFIPKLNEAGYRVIAFDAPAHGGSQGVRTNLLEFMEVANILYEKYGPWKGCIGHSLGGITAYLLITGGMVSNCLITIGSPSRQNDIFRTFFCRRLKGDMSSVEYLKKWIINHIGFDFEEVFPIHKKPLENPESLLVIHDEDDEDAMVSEASLLQSGNPGSQKMITKGLGHIRILWDEKVIDRSVQFIQENDS